MNEDWVFKRGDLYFANLNPYFGSEQGGTRPVLVLQNNMGNFFCPTLIVAPLTSKWIKSKRLISGAFYPTLGKYPERKCAPLMKLCKSAWTSISRKKWMHHELAFLSIRRRTMFEEKIAALNRANEQSAVCYEKRTYTVDEIQDILGISRPTAYNLVKKGLFHSVRVGGHIRISKKSFDEWLDQKS